MRRSSSFSRSRVISSSAPNGSSISSSRGPPSSARAIETRWRMPPESSCGKLLLPAFEPDELEQLARRRRAGGQAAEAADLERQLDVLQRRAPGQQRGILEHEAERARSCRASCGVMPNTETWPLDGAIRSATTRSKVDLPQPDGPSRLRKPPRSTAKRDVLQRRDGAPLGDEAHRHVAARRPRSPRRRHGERRLAGATAPAPARLSRSSAGCRRSP